MRNHLLALALTLLSAQAFAKTHFNSRTKIITDTSAGPRFRSLVMADMTGDGLKEFVGFTQDINGFEISVGQGDYPNSLIARMDSHGSASWLNADGSAVLIDQVFVGKFTSSSKENFCFRSRTPAYYGVYARVYCFEVSGSSVVQSYGSGFTVPVSWLAGYQQLAGDFDGDGFDELITYDGGNGGNVHMFEWNQYVAGAIYMGLSDKSDFDASNLSGFNFIGGISMYAGNFANFSGEGTRDDLFVYNQTTGNSWVFHSRLAGGKTVFWALIGPYGGLLTSREEPVIADADGDGYEDLITHDTLYGWNRYRSLQTPTLFSSLASNHPDQGNIKTYASATENHLYMGKLRYVYEGGSSLMRDDAIEYDVSTATYHRYDARFCAPASCGGSGVQTYWAYYDFYQSMFYYNFVMTYGGVP
jgi:hypothetical protein